MKLQISEILTELKCGRCYLDSRETRWEICLQKQSGGNPYGFKDYVLSVRPERAVQDVTITVIEERTAWNRQHYVFAPAAAYAGNRFKSLPLPYPPIAVGVVDDVPDPEIVITDVPRLSADGSRQMELMAGDLAKPLFGYYDETKHTAFYFLFPQQSLVGRDNSIRVSESGDKAEFSLVVPARRKSMYRHMCSTVRSDDVGADLAAGQTVLIRFRLYELPCHDLMEYFSIFSDIRKEFDPPGRIENTIPFYKAFKAVEHKYNLYNWVCGEEFYRSSTAGRDSICSQWQTGWVGGGISTYPCLITGSHLSKTRSLQTLEFLFREIMAENGFMYGIFCHGRRYGDSIDPKGEDTILLIRKFTDALYFLLKQFMWLDEKREAFPAAWREGVRRSLTTLQELFVDNGQFGQFVDIRTKKLLVRGTSSAATGIGALALGGAYFRDDALMQTAKEAGLYYYTHYVQRGISNGGPGEICQCPDSESIFGLLESYMALYDVTEEECWLTCAQASADLASSWCVAYDFHFPENSQFAVRDIHTTGAVWASIQNKHAGPGICTLSGVSLFKLYRATGKRKYLELFREIAHNLTQYVSLDENPFRNSWGGIRYGEYSPEGASGERINLSDWEGKENVGEFPGGSCWCEVTMLLNYVENPGVYVIKDREEVYCFDHVSCRVTQANNDRLLLEMENETNYDTIVTLFEENVGQQKQSMGCNPWELYRKIAVDSHQTVTVVIDK